MKKPKAYRLHIIIQLTKASLAQTGQALGQLLQRYMSPRLISCTTERLNDTEVSQKTEKVIRQLLWRSSPWEPAADQASLETRTISLDDVRVARLAKGWDRADLVEYTVVVPHLFYLPLLHCFRRNLELRAPELIPQACLVFDYARLQHLPEIVRQCFLGERARVLKYVSQTGLTSQDPGRQLFLENLISVACYTMPARYLVFVDDDFFINHPAAVGQLLAPLRRGYLLSGRFASSQERIHTSFFALRPEALRAELQLFDEGENLYSDQAASTGTITYRAWSQLEQGVFSLGEYQDDDTTFGRHLCHCATELWNDLPVILAKHFRFDRFPANIGRTRLDGAILLEALALLHGIQPQAGDYFHIGNDLRFNALEAGNFAAYFGKIYHNHHWLLRQAEM
jgi:hypothetical protein